jgi:hypothetical protein
VSKHTKGPWYFEEDGLGCKSICHNVPDEWHAEGKDKELCYTTGLAEEEEDLANAHLIAAAPDMLEALFSAVWYLNEGIEPPDYVIEGYEAVIRKAKGKE